jgi:hypothetical protein
LRLLRLRGLMPSLLLLLRRLLLCGLQLRG